MTLPLPPPLDTMTSVTHGSASLEPEQIVSYEAGYQGWFLRHRLRVHALLPQIEALWLMPDSTVLTEDSLSFLLGTALDANVPVIGFFIGARAQRRLGRSVGQL